jgi:hypothetical protein
VFKQLGFPVLLFPFLRYPVAHQRATGASRSSIVTITLTLFFLLSVSVSGAAVFNCPSGDVSCLITAIKAANATGEADTINLEAGSYILNEAAEVNDDGPNGLPSITTAITIVGKGPTRTVIEIDPSIQPSLGLRILHVGETGILDLDGIALRGTFSFIAPDSTGIFNLGTTNIFNAMIEGHLNTFNSGGGIFNAGTMTVTDSTISRNLVIEGNGSGIANFGGTIKITRSTIANNGFSEGGGGIAASGGSTNITESAIIDNSAVVGGGILVSGGRVPGMG